MAITLNPSLKTAQDGISHRPIIKITSDSQVNDIPFDGQFLTSETTNEQRPNLITHSSGRICGIYTYSTNQLKYVATDTSRTIWNFTSLTAVALGCITDDTIIEASLCELIDGRIGIIFATTYTADYFLRYAILSVDGIIETTGLIATYDHVSYSSLKSPFVILLASGSYLLVYILDDISSFSRVYKRTSTDFIVWSAESEITFASLSTNKKENISLHQIDTGNIFLWLDYYDNTNYANIYYAISTDNGATWSDVTAVTTYADPSAYGLHPISFQKTANQIYLVYYEKRGAVHLGEGDPGWPPWPGGAGVSDLYLDVTTRRLYCTCTRTFTGYKTFVAIVEVNIDTWEVVRYWDTSTTPGFPVEFTPDGTSMVWWLSWQGNRGKIPIGNRATAVAPIGDYAGSNSVYVLDVIANTITEYTYSPGAGAYSCWLPDVHLIRAHVSEFKDYMVVVSGREYSNLSDLYFSYESFDGDIPLFVLSVLGDSYFLPTGQPAARYGPDLYDGAKNGHIWMDSNDRLFFSTSTTVSDWRGYFFIFDPGYYIETGGEYLWTGPEYHWGGWSYDEDGNNLCCMEGESEDCTVCVPSVTLGPIITMTGGSDGYPYRGFTRFVVVDKKIYGIFPYDGEHEPDKRGLCEIDLSPTGFDPDVPGSIKDLHFIISFHRPSWATIDDYGFSDITATDDGRLVISGTYGITIFDPSDGSWRLLDNETLPGFTPDGQNVCWPVKYDPVTQMIFTGIPCHLYSTWEGVIGVPIDGYILKSYYRLGTYAAGWSFGAATEFIIGYHDYEAVVALDPVDKLIYTFWTNQTGDEFSIKWDKETAAQFDLTPYLLLKTEVILKWNIENRASELSFAISHGHLFDPMNEDSILRQHLMKGCKITVKMGEEVSGIEIWQNQGTFVVTDFRLSGFERGKYPDVSVQCKGQMVFWAEQKQITTDFYETTPELTITDILTSLAGVDVGDISLPTFDTSTTIYKQWLDTDILTMLSEICDRFGYFLYETVDGEITCRKISDDNDVDHTYTDNNMLIRWSPQDDQADFVNQIVVIGETHDFIDDISAEEAVVTKNGTTGWWDGKKKIACYYSEDRSRICQNPRLEWHQQLMSFGKWGGNISAYIEEHTDQKGCDLIIDAPDLIIPLILLIGSITTLWAVPDDVQVGPSGTGFTIPVGRIGEAACLVVIFDILMSVTNWQATIWAETVGKVRQSIQAAANDAEYQISLGRIISEEIEESMCYTVEQCQEVANYELMLKQLQRNRLTISKIAHLQDEVGDTFSFIHPWSGNAIKMFVTSLTRRYKQADGEKDGYVIDDLEVWKL